MDDSLSLIFSALADPTRRKIIEILSIKDATVNELAEPFNMSLPAISKHLKVLEKSNLITKGRDAQSRPCKIKIESLKEALNWIEKYKLF
jgi:DNA-binding transcriptional ArsR family regulator